MNCKMLRFYVSNIHREDLDFKRICNNFSEEDILKVRANEDFLKHCMHVLSETIIERQDPTNKLIIIYNHIRALLDRLNGQLPGSYAFPIMGGW